MSVLSVPRIFFKGHMACSPATMNNNDQWPTYDSTNASLNWEFLRTQVPAITPANAEAVFPTWARTLKHFRSPPDPPPPPPPGASPPWYQPEPESWYQPPAEWNYYGGNGVSLHTPTSQTFVTGGQSGYGGPVLTRDPLVGAVVDIAGDPYPGTTFGTDARLVDTNPGAFWTTSFLVRSFMIGNQSDPGNWMTGLVEPGSLSSSRWMNVQRNLDTTLPIAGIAGCVIQACLPSDLLTITPRGSPLLKRLEAALDARGVRGVMVRASLYMTRYFGGPEFANCRGRSQQYQTLVALWAADLAAGRVPTQNPTTSEVVGTVGLWMDDELVSVPGGRFLVAATKVPFEGGNPTAPHAAFGPAVAQIDVESGFVTLDLGNAIPEVDGSCRKGNFGSLHVVLTDSVGSSTTLGTIDPAGYGQAAYASSAGIVDLELPPGLTAEQLSEGDLAVVAVTDAGTSTTALVEVPLTVETDDRAIWVDQGRTCTFTVTVRHRGAPPAETVRVLLQQYLPCPAPPEANPMKWVLPSHDQPDVVRFENADANVITVPASSGGVAQVEFTPLRPGFPTIAFFPFPAREPTPTPPATVAPVFVSGGPKPEPSITTAFFCTVRVMPCDDHLPENFRDVWVDPYDPRSAWQFVYRNILALYSLTFPVMQHHGALNLGEKESVDRNIALILRLCDESMAGSTVYMPVTRDLSAGKRRVLEMYGWLVEQDWPKRPVPLSTGPWPLPDSK